MICRELTDACKEGDLVCARALIARGADIDYADPAHDTWYNWTPLMHAAVRGDADLVSLLLAAGADVHYKDRDGNTALTLAAREGHFSVVVPLLLDRGADPTARDHCDQSAADYARRDGQTAVADRMRNLPAGAAPPVDAGAAPPVDAGAAA